MKAKNVSQFRACWKAGVPLISIDTNDPAQSVRNSIYGLNGKGNDIPLLEWDCVQGLRGTNLPGQPCELGAKAAMEIADGTPGPEMLTNPVETLALIARKAPKDSIIFLHGMHRLIGEAPVAQALWNCRDICKAEDRHINLVCLGPGFQFPAELAQDIMSLSEDLPNESELEEVLNDTLKSASFEPSICTGEDRKRAIDSLRGLSAFSAEQVVATSITKAGLDLGALWERKVKVIEATDGLTVYRPKPSETMGGLSNAFRMHRNLMRGKLELSCLVLFDEIDKGMAASGTDTSGTTQDQSKVLLSYMQDNDITGELWLGPPGTGKTQLAKCIAAEFNVPLIMFDLGACKGSLVGQSEQKMRAAIKIIHSISGGKPLFIGACNRTETLPPELRRRFNYCSMFFDLPTAEERKAIWQVWIKRYGLTPGQIDTVKDDGWTGAEIRNCCLKAWAEDIKLSEAAITIVPVSKSAADLVNGLRQAASGKYVSASNPGLYQFSQVAGGQTASQQSGRKIEV